MMDINGYLKTYYYCGEWASCSFCGSRLGASLAPEPGHAPVEAHLYGMTELYQANNTVIQCLVQRRHFTPSNFIGRNICHHEARKCKNFTRRYG